MTLEKLFQHPGWKLIKEQAQASADEAKLRAAFAPSWDVNRANLGQYHAFLSIVNLDESTALEFEAIAKANADSAEVDDSLANE